MGAVWDTIQKVDYDLDQVSSPLLLSCSVYNFSSVTDFSTFNFSPSSTMILAHFSCIWPPNHIMPASSVLENLLPADGRYCLSNVMLSFTSVPPLWDQEHEKKQEPKSETDPQDKRVSKRSCVV